MNKLKRSTFLLAVSLTALLSAGCNDKVLFKTEYDCDKGVAQKKSGFILQCLSNANPRSDEEPEDWILYCEDMAKRTFCATVEYKYTYAFNWQFIAKEKLNR